MKNLENYPWKRTIAVVEDDLSLRTDLVEFLLYRDIQAIGFSQAEELLAAWPQYTFDLVILDINLPGMSGIQTLEWLRTHSQIGVVMLTALNGQEEQVNSLSKGADAYLIKGATLKVIEATCLSVLRRTSTEKQALNETVTSTWRLLSQSWLLQTPEGSEVALTYNESLFLQTLMQHPGQSVDRAKLLTMFDKPDTISNRRNMDNYANRLRRKVKKSLGLDLPLRPCYGEGYTFAGKCSIEDL